MTDFTEFSGCFGVREAYILVQFWYLVIHIHFILFTVEFEEGYDIHLGFEKQGQLYTKKLQPEIKSFLFKNPPAHLNSPLFLNSVRSNPSKPWRMSEDEWNLFKRATSWAWFKVGFIL